MLCVTAFDLLSCVCPFLGSRLGVETRLDDGAMRSQMGLRKGGRCTVEEPTGGARGGALDSARSLFLASRSSSLIHTAISCPRLPGLGSAFSTYRGILSSGRGRAPTMKGAKGGAGGTVGTTGSTFVPPRTTGAGGGHGGTTGKVTRASGVTGACGRAGAMSDTIFKPPYTGEGVAGKESGRPSQVLK